MSLDSRQYIKRFRTWCDKVITFSEGNVSSLIEVVVGGGVDLPCDTSPPRYYNVHVQLYTTVRCTPHTLPYDYYTGCCFTPPNPSVAAAKEGRKI